MKLTHAAALLFVAIAVATLGGRTSKDARASHLCEGRPFDFDTHEQAVYEVDYAAEIELVVAGAAVASPIDYGNGEVVDLTYQGVEAGPRTGRVPADPAHRIPPTIYKSIVWIESNWANAGGAVPYGGVGPTLRSAHDCGYGLGQITTGMHDNAGKPSAKQSLIGTHPLFNLAEGVRILADKWNAAPETRPIAGEGNPAYLEDWYYAIWSYNGFAFLNHPLNPNLDPLRGGNEVSPLYHCFEPLAHSYQEDADGFVRYGYGDYTYPERVYGCMKYPPQLFDESEQTNGDEPQLRTQSQTPKFTPGEQAQVSADGDGLRLRSAPGLDTEIFSVLPDTTIVTIISGPVTTDELNWWEIDTPAGVGWSAEDFLELLLPTPTPPVPDPTPTVPPDPLPSPVLEGKRLWPPVDFRMPEFRHPAIAQAFDPQNFFDCTDNGLVGGCPSMDYPTSIPDWSIEPHEDPTLPVDPALSARYLSAPRISSIGRTEMFLWGSEGSDESGDTIQILNIGTGIAPFRVHPSADWIKVRHPDDVESRILDAGVAIGSDVEVVIQKEPRLTQQGFNSLLRISLNHEFLPEGVSTGTVIIEPLLGDGNPIVINITARNGDEPPPRTYRLGAPALDRN
ncbi:MAG TPA: SH3 domain-containing protein [Dehalococcoidia bacterium]|nr:SH3 domain-containing protein [Dehalococcoidia bacterium]